MKHHTLKHPYLQPERDLVADLIRRDRPVLGICLGAQMVARAAGARVYASWPKEIGLFDVELTAAARQDPLFRGVDSPLEVFQWHGDTFDWPSGAVWLARSERFPHQAFRLGRRVYGLQFHLEVTLPTARQWFRDWRDEVAAIPAQDRPRLEETWLEVSLTGQLALANLLARRWQGLFDVM